jgi:hypothetical protein
MKALKIKGTLETPEIKFDGKTGIFLISGISIPENITLFYYPVIEWIKDYAYSPQRETTLKINLDYFNTPSSKMLLDIFETFKLMHDMGHNVIINWYYDEDDECMQIAGEDYSDIVGIPFNLISCKAKAMVKVF